MICEPGKDAYKLPDKWFGLYDHPVLETDHRDRPYFSVRLMQLAPDEMVKLQKTAEKQDGRDKIRAQPRYFAIVRDEFWLFPVPDKAYVVLTRYHQHPKVW